MRRNSNIRRQQRLRLEILEKRNLLAAAGFFFQLYEDVDGAPGAEIADAQVDTNETFFVEITAREYNPYRRGLQGVSLDIHWDASLLEVMESDFDPTTVVTDDLPLMRMGELHNASGDIFGLSGAAMLSANAGRLIGNTRPETFAMIRVQALDEAGSLVLTMREGGLQITPAPVADLRGDDLYFENQTIEIIAPPQAPASPDIESAPLVSEASEVFEMSEMSEMSEVSAASKISDLQVDFDAHQDGLFDLGDSGVLHLQSVQPPTLPLDIQAAPTAVEAVEAADSDTSEVSDSSVAGQSVLKFQHVCMPMPPTDALAAETGLDVRMQASLDDADLRRRRRGLL